MISKWDELGGKGEETRTSSERENRGGGREGGERQQFLLLLSVIPEHEVPSYQWLVLVFSLTVFFIIRIMPVITSSLPGIL